MPTYADLPPHVQAVVDRKAQELVAREGVELQAARDAIAERVVIIPARYTKGAGR